MNIELITTGTELLLGSVTNTNQQWLCRELTFLGHVVTRHVTVADTADALQQGVREAIRRADLVITTGGLGPTSDDLTRQAIAQLLNRPLHQDRAVLAHIEAFFRQRNRPMPAQTAVQALVPAGATILPNGNGTAPGLVLEIPPGEHESPAATRLLIMLPGPPRELQPMFSNQVAPLLKTRFPAQAGFCCRVLKSTGIGESAVEERIARPLAPLVADGLEIGYCARFGEVDVRLLARGGHAQEVVGQAEQIVSSVLGKHLFGYNDDQLEFVVVRALTARAQTLALAESCTGGYIAHRVTNVPGASVVFLGAFVTYSNESKQTCLGVQPETLARHGAVSKATAREMAEGARARVKATYALAVTGIAGPTGGTPEKPVGTVYIALSGPRGTRVLHEVNPYDRESFKFVTSQQALELLRRDLLE